MPPLLVTLWETYVGNVPLNVRLNIPSGSSLLFLKVHWVLGGKVPRGPSDDQCGLSRKLIGYMEKNGNEFLYCSESSFYKCSSSWDDCVILDIRFVYVEMSADHFIIRPGM